MSGTSLNVYDYPDPPEPPEILCDECKEPIGPDGAWSVEGRWICAECMAEYLKTNYSPAELADELGFQHVSIEYLNS